MVVKIFFKNGTIICTVLASLMLAGCGGNEFDPAGTLGSRAVRLDGEQVALTAEQLDCGTREELWTIFPLGDGRSVGRLTQKGRDLQFSDDVQIGDQAIGTPYVQIHGTFPVQVFQVGSIHDEDAFTKVGDAKVGVRIDQKCFQASSPLVMGVRHGQFDLSVRPVFRFKMDGEWSVDQVIH